MWMARMHTTYYYYYEAEFCYFGPWRHTGRGAYSEAVQQIRLSAFNIRTSHRSLDISGSDEKSRFMT